MRLAGAVAALTMIAPQPVAAQPQQNSAAVFALIDSNEWCPGGSVYLDLQTGSFMLFPRLKRPACSDRKANVVVKRGVLGAPALQRLRLAYAEARRAGLSREKCDLVISNGGPQALVITAPGYSQQAPENLGCWTKEAYAFYEALFDAFGKQR